MVDREYNKLDYIARLEIKYKNLNILKYLYDKPAEVVKKYSIIYGERFDKFYEIESSEAGKILECKMNAPDCATSNTEDEFTVI